MVSIMVGTYKEQSAETLKRIINEGYYPSVLDAALTNQDMSICGIEHRVYSDAQLGKFWNDFWFMLPESPAVRCGPFLDLCHLAEEAL
jgi:hypothetical protein